KISVSAPALAKALAESYSQLVPGKTGIKTRGLAVLTEAAKVFFVSQEMFCGFSPPVLMLQG
ncbi:hypothetical protein OSL60_28320, partial [Escherichia coli]|nr:hypothetical protein [Escherichia coli]